MTYRAAPLRILLEPLLLQRHNAQSQAACHSCHAEHAKSKNVQGSSPTCRMAWPKRCLCCSIICCMQNFVDTPGPGRLLVNPQLYPIGYATNQNEPIISEINLANSTRTKTMAFNTSLATKTACPGADNLAYSPLNQQ